MTRGDGYDSLYEAIGERIAHSRQMLSLSQAKLAGKVGVTRTSIVNIEHGRQRPPLHLIWQIATVLGIDVVKLIPSPSELSARSEATQLDAQIVASIKVAARDNQSAKRLLTEFIKKAKKTIEGEDATS